MVTPGHTSIELFSKRLVKNYGVSERNLKRILEKELIYWWNTGLVNPDANFWRKYGKKLGIKNAPFHKFNDFAMEDYQRSSKPHKGILLLVKRLKKKYKLGVLSNINRISGAVNKKRGVFRDFNVLVLSYEIKCVKPQRKIYKVAAKKMKLPPKNLLFIDDKLKNVKAARKFGMHAIHFLSFSQLKRNLKNLNII